MTDILKQVLEALMQFESTLDDARIRNILADDLESAYMFAIMNMRYLKKNQEENQEKTA